MGKGGGRGRKGVPFTRGLSSYTVEGSHMLSTVLWRA